MKKATGQFIRYAAVGIASNIIGFFLYLVLTAAGMEHKLAMTILYGVGVAQTFVFNKRWSFSYQGLSHAAFLRYIVAYALGYLLNLSLLLVFVDRLHLPHQGVQAVAIVLVAASLFLLNKFWVFPSPTVRERAR